MRRNVNENQSRFGFTLIELLVVISIIALLVGILLPALGAARKSAQTVKCASNMRQLGIGFAGYSTDNSGMFPANQPGTGNKDTWWYQSDVIGGYLPGGVETATGSIGGLTLPCPSDIDNAARSYTMNYWASSYVDKSITHKFEYWNAGSPNQSKLMLAMEAWSVYLSESEWFARPWLGSEAYTPYKHFVENPETAITYERGITSLPPSKIDFNRHSTAGTPFDAEGSANFLYADGHVTGKSDSTLVDRATKKSTYDSLWAPNDENIENP
ncbi:MAG: type II secretion system protein [Phycisphaerales bacterium]